MATDREKIFNDKPLERVADVMAGCGSDSKDDRMARAEFMLRQTKAQIDAAQATKDTALYTRKYTRYMFWSVVILAFSALGNFILEIIRKWC